MKPDTERQAAFARARKMRRAKRTVKSVLVHSGKQKDPNYSSLFVSAIGGGFVGSSLGIPGAVIGLIGGGLLGVWADKHKHTNQK